MDERNVLRWIMGIGPNDKPYVRNPDGSVSTERLATEAHPMLNQGRWTNFPTMWQGEQLGLGSALSRALMHPQGFPSYGTLGEAEMAAKKQSAGHGVLIDLLRGQTEPLKPWFKVNMGARK